MASTPAPDGAVPLQQPRWATVLPCDRTSEHTFLLVACYAMGPAAEEAETGSSLLRTSGEGVRLTRDTDLLDFCRIDVAEVGGAATIAVAPDALAVSSLAPPGMGAAMYRRLLEDALLHRAGTGADGDGGVEVCAVPAARPGASVGAVELRLAMQPTAMGTGPTQSRSGSGSGTAPHFVLARTELCAEADVRATATRRAAVLGPGTTAFAFFCRQFAAQSRHVHAVRLALASAVLETRQLRQELEACAVAAVREREETWLQSVVGVLNEKKRKIRELTAELERVKRGAAAAATQVVLDRPSAGAARGVKPEASRAGRRRQRSPAGPRDGVVKREPAASTPTASSGAFTDSDEGDAEASLPGPAAPAPRTLSTATSDTTADDTESDDDQRHRRVATSTALSGGTSVTPAAPAQSQQPAPQQPSTPQPAAVPFSATKWMDDLFGV